MLKFLRFVGRREKDADPAEAATLRDRVLLCVTDRPGFVAASDVLGMFRPFSFWILESTWRQWRTEQETADPVFSFHYEYRTIWHRGLKAEWTVPLLEPGDLWAHEESYQFQPCTGVAAVHLWNWTGMDLQLVGLMERRRL